MTDAAIAEAMVIGQGVAYVCGMCGVPAFALWQRRNVRNLLGERLLAATRPRSSTTGVCFVAWNCLRLLVSLSLAGFGIWLVVSMAFVWQSSAMAASVSAALGLCLMVEAGALTWRRPYLDIRERGLVAFVCGPLAWRDVTAHSWEPVPAEQYDLLRLTTRSGRYQLRVHIHDRYTIAAALEKHSSAPPPNEPQRPAEGKPVS